MEKKWGEEEKGGEEIRGERMPFCQHPRYICPTGPFTSNLFLWMSTLLLKADVSYTLTPFVSLTASIYIYPFILI